MSLLAGGAAYTLAGCLPAGGKLRQPTIIDCVVVDHRNTLALLDQFDGVSAAGRVVGEEVGHRRGGEHCGCDCVP